jgi:hypothetical protein
MPDEKKDSHSGNATNQIVLWLAIGVSIGTALGVAFNNIPIGIALGVMIGTSIGVTLSQKTKKG